jgi:hypothetical protein
VGFRYAKTRPYYECPITILRFRADLVRSKSGEVLGLIKDQKEGSTTWGVNNRVTNLSDAKFVFNSWARAIRARLDIIHGY